MNRRLSGFLIATALFNAAVGSSFAQSYPGVVRMDDFGNGVTGTSGGLHAGLLGKMYLQGRYIHVHTDDPAIAPVDDTFQGFEVTFNAPIPWFQFVAPGVGADVFFTFQQIGVDGSVMGVSFDADVDSYQVGTSLYADVFGPVRPFVQLGVEHNVFSASASLGPISSSITDDDTDLLLNLGVEADLGQMASVRLMLDIDTDKFDESPFTADLILWPHERIFLRAGVFVTLTGDEVGGQFGGGIVF